jgi:hypothetical protein
MTEAEGERTAKGVAMPTWDGQRERRAFPRRAARGSARYRDLQQRALTDFPAQLVDLSQAGVGLVVGQPLAPGQVIELVLVPSLGRPVERTASVRWALALPGGGYRVGCPLEPRLPYADLQRLG